MDDLRPQYNEYMVGANDPDHEDTLNRAFNVQHNPDGTHPDSLLGFQGAQGESGPQGAQGNQGTEGSQGSQGPQGNQGSQGDIGQQGFQGSQGETGAQGPQGAAGAQGAQGDNGAQGFQGSQGSQGVQGGDGLGVSWQGAYDGDTPYGQGAGVSFSDELYISLEAGNQGNQPDISSSKWELFAGAQGPQGAQGSTGAQGPQGNIGSQGVAGPQGTQGRQGVVGATGSQGPQGKVGAQGTQGRQGYQGKQGSTGAQGLVGPQGYSGSQGPSGPQGTTGPQGAAGPSLRDITKNLKIVVAVATYNVATITADGAILSTSSNITKAYINISIASVNLGSSGANGLDTGSRAAHTWYNLWLIGKADGTIAGLWSLSATSPTMPTGYTYKAWVGSARTYADHLSYSVQNGNIVSHRIPYDTIITISSYGEYNISTYVPPKAIACSGYAVLSGEGKSQLLAYIWPYMALDGIGQVAFYWAGPTGYTTSLNIPWRMPLLVSQKIGGWAISGSLQLMINGWEYP